MAKAISIWTKVTSVEEIKHYRDDKYKLAFKCESTNPEPRLCIYWGYGIPQKIQTGDSVNLNGYIKNNVFLVSSLLYQPRKEN